MIDRDAKTPQREEAAIPLEQAKQMRRLSHDLSNSLEVILQTSYLLGTLDLADEAKEWLALLDQGVQQSAAINSDLREYIRNHS